MKKASALIILATLLVTSQALSHCQIPCGIYDDDMRLDMIEENIATIEKAIRQVDMLASAPEPDFNQIVRWITVKDEHADDIADILSWYFLQQRVKPVEAADTEGYKDYVAKLKALHEMLVYSMKAKQSSDLANVEKLKSLHGEFARLYMGREHGQGHHH